MTLYTCSVCGKSTQIDTSGSITFTNCLLTLNCKGRLYKDTNVGNVLLNKNVTNRIKLDVLTQPLLSYKWVGRYNVNTIPHVFVYRKNSDGTYTQLTSGYTISIDSNGDLNIDFTTATSGLAHIISHTSFRLPEKVVPDIEYTNMSSNGVLTIASKNVNDSIQKTLTFTDPTTNTSTNVEITFTAHRSSNGISLFNTPWRTIAEIVLESSTYKLFSCNLNQFITPTLNVPWNIDFGTDIPLLSMEPNTAIQDCDLSKSCVSKCNGIMNPPNLQVEASQIYLYYPQMRFKTTIFSV